MVCILNVPPERRLEAAGIWELMQARKGAWCRRSLPKTGIVGLNSAVGIARRSHKPRMYMDKPDTACAATTIFGLRRESRRAGATPLSEVGGCAKSGVAATLCHRTPNLCRKCVNFRHCITGFELRASLTLRVRRSPPASAWYPCPSVSTRRARACPPCSRTAAAGRGRTVVELRFPG
jgi:hypothetical protein